MTFNRDMFRIFALSFILLFMLLGMKPLHAEGDFPVSYEAKVVKVVEEKIAEDGTLVSQKLELEFLTGEFEGKKYIISNGGDDIAEVNSNKYKEGEKVVVLASTDSEGNTLFYITDYVRRAALGWLTLLFIIVALLVGKWRSLTSLFGLIFSFFVILKFIIPQIALGDDPVLVTVVGSLFILPATFYLSHGVNAKTSIALLGTLGAIIITGVLSVLFVNLSKLTGFNSEEVGILSALTEGTINMKGLLLSGIIIGALGVLDDITVSQAAVVFQLKEATKGKISFHEIFVRAMEVGKDHIASMINTLFLVYAGASLPLLLLFTDNPRSFAELINYEPIATEVIRTLIGSIGLMLAVPVTTMLSFFYLKNSSK